MMYSMKKNTGETLPVSLVTLLLGIALTATMLIGVVGCAGERGNAVEFYDMVDLQPPKLEEVRVKAANSIELCIDEEVSVVEQSLQLSEPLTLESYGQSECGVGITLGMNMSPGGQYTVSMTVVDGSGNSLDIIADVYGYNDRIPEIVVNEFTTRGSARHPDIVELYVQSGGNIGGLTLYEGSATNWESRKIFPAVELEAGSYVLVHFKPQGTEEAGEKDETLAPNISGGLDVHEAAWDFWVEDGNGLSGNNGVLTLTATPDGQILDAVLYTNRSSESDSKYRGFGTARNLALSDELHGADQWTAATQQIRPEDVVSVDDSTATRSICRGSNSLDSNDKADWHIVPTSAYSLGEQNTDDVYERS